MIKDKKLGLISLGCDKNRVDSERILAVASKHFKITSNVSEAQIIVVNTCAFLESARKEAIDTVFEINSLRETGNLEKIIVCGCLPQKFINEIFSEFIEVDAFLGINDYDLLYDAIKLCYDGQRVNFVNKNENLLEKNRILTTPCHYYYLKIADGCNNRCTYCLIPSIRGKYRSQKIEDLISEVKSLGEVNELILVAQDVTRYGIDLYGEPKIVELLKELSKLDEVNSIRILYAYPDMITSELIEEIKRNQKIIKYLDIPLQHASNPVLKLMNRKGTYDNYLALVNKLKAEIPGISIRSTFIAGFPRETEEDFNTLVSFVKKAKFFNCGFFAYSREEGTPAYKLSGQIDEKVKNERVKKLYKVQRQISKNNLKTFVGKTIKVLCDGVDYEKQAFYGRAYFNAPDIDGRVYIESNECINQGEYYTVLITDSNDYDLFGKVIN
ncbi:MAG: 30S ribosomal protein S12 methylthiotransferase RimO [Clostridia bacterium]|nr:30S ribosomal protein S12 methylthiotransferase RimO [Clostridia bacterium]